ncbi:hypothetical protein ACHWQZ_G006188 [Mnemiopsis leidyi]
MTVSPETTSTVIGNVNTEEDIVVTGENREIQGEGIVIGNENVIREADVQGLPSPSKKKQARCRPSKKVAIQRVRAMIHYIRKSKKRKQYYQNKDVEAMKREHAKVEEEHTHENCLVANIQSLVFGGVDGIITSFAVVAAIAGAGYSTFYILAIGIANLIADGFSMGLGDYLSSDSEIKFAKMELAREEWEYDNYQQGEEQEMIEIFKAKGMTQEDAEIVIRTTAKYRDVFCNDMMIHELGLTPPDDDDSPIKSGLVTFIAFIICGIVPLLVYMFVDVHSSSGDTNFYISIGMTAAALFILGALKVIPGMKNGTYSLP